MNASEYKRSSHCSWKLTMQWNSTRLLEAASHYAGAV